MQPPVNYRDKQLTSAENGRELAATIDDAIRDELPEDIELLTIYAERIRLCNQPDNIWTGDDLCDKHGVAYNAAGRFWTCGLKLCPYCLSRQTRINRRKLRQHIDGIKMPVGQKFVMLTLTMPTQDLPLIEARAIMNDAWELFRKKRWFQRTITGGCKSEEFTLNKIGYHYHMHVLAQSKYIHYDSFRHFWTLAVVSAFRKHGRILDIKIADGMLDANARDIDNMDKAVQEVAKYITKTSNWAKIKTGDLLDICRIKRFPRMFELFGSFRNARKPASNKTILDTEELSDDLNEPTWRETVRRHGAVAYLPILHEEINDMTHYRMKQLKWKYKSASFRRLARPPGSPYQNAINRLEILAREFVRRNRPHELQRLLIQSDHRNEAEKAYDRAVDSMKPQSPTTHARL